MPNGSIDTHTDSIKQEPKSIMSEWHHWGLEQITKRRLEIEAEPSQ